MNHEFEYDGFWWLPETPENEVPGKLRFIPGEKITLDLQGTLNSPKDNRFHPPKFIEPEIITGYSLAGKDITLQRCLQVSSHTHIGGVQTSSFIASIAYINVHFDAANEVRFQNLHVHYTFLDEWMDKQGFSIEQPENTKLIVRYEKPSPVRIHVSDYDISFVLRGPSYDWNPLTHVNVVQKAAVVISPITERPLTDYLDPIRHIQDFLSLAMAVPTFPIEIKGLTDANKQVANGKELRLPVDIYYALPWSPSERKAPHPAEMLFTLPSIQDALETHLNNWIDKAKALKPVYDLYFSTLYSPPTFLELRFLSLAQAIETYHRRMLGGKYQADEEFLAGLYKTLVEAIPSDLESDFRRSLKEGKLKYANEYSLRKRLHELTLKYSSSVPFGFLRSKTDRIAFVDKVCNTRNYLTHYSTELEAQSTTRGEELFRLAEQLRALLEIIFLEELGFSMDAIQEMVSKNRRYKTVLTV